MFYAARSLKASSSIPLKNAVNEYRLSITTDRWPQPPVENTLRQVFTYVAPDSALCAILEEKLGKDIDDKEDDLRGINVRGWKRRCLPVKLHSFLQYTNNAVIQRTFDGRHSN